MLINNNPPPSYKPNFQQTAKLPTRKVLECITGQLSNQSIKEPGSLINIFRKIFNLNPNDIKDIPKTPMAFDIYFLASGKQLTKQNPNLEVLSTQLNSIPKNMRAEKIEETTRKMGEFIEVTI